MKRPRRHRHRMSCVWALALAFVLFAGIPSLYGQGGVPEGPAEEPVAEEPARQPAAEAPEAAAREKVDDGEDTGEDEGIEGEITTTNKVSYQLPTDGELPQNYRVTLAAAPKDNPNWLVATFVAGAVRTVTEENQGRFTETWNGLDDNYMPVPPGDYVVRGICMPAAKWHMDGQYHTLTARYITGVGDSWSPPPDQDRKFPWVFGHCFGGIRDIDVAPNGMASFQFNYIENSWNPFLVDLNKPINYDQVKARYPSGGAGGTYTACDGKFIWVSKADKKFPHVYRTDRRWGNTINKYGVRCVKLKVPATDVCAWFDAERKRRFVYIVQPAPENKVLIYDGTDATLLKEIPVRDPRSLVLDKAEPGSRLHVLHKNKEGAGVVTALMLAKGTFSGKWERTLTLAGETAMLDFDVDGKGVVYLVPAGKNEILTIEPKTGKRAAFGKLPAPGKFDKLALHNPDRVAVWKDKDGKERVLVIERGGPGRISEWTPKGEFLRQWFLAHTAAYGYCLDPEEPTHLYHVANSGQLIRYNVDYGQAVWEVDCAWPLPIGGRLHPKIINREGRTYITFPGGNYSHGRFAVYRIVGDKCLPSAGIIPDKTKPENQQITKGHWWHDANGNGRVETAEFNSSPANVPGAQWWGDRWLDDLSLAVFAGDVKHMRLAPTGFDRHGNPVYDGARWQPLLADPIHERRKAKKPLPALYGGNEMPTFYGQHWIHLEGTPAKGFYVADSFGKNNPGGTDTAGSYFSQVKLSRYVPDGKGGYSQRWRVGRKALRLMEHGQMYASHYFCGETAGMVGIFDSNGIYHVFTNEGFYVDTVGIDAFRYGLQNTGMYASSGEHWHGSHYQSKKDGKVYLCMGRAQMTVYEIENWKQDICEPLKASPDTIRLAAAFIAPPHPLAAKLRGGDNQVKVANFYASAGGPPDPGDDDDWAGAESVTFGLDKERAVEVQCKFDPDTIYLRWHVRLPKPFEPVAVAEMTRLFTHETGADTVSFYIQGDPRAAPGKEKGRPGDLRIVFAVVKDDNEKLKPVALGLYPKWSGPGEATAVTYVSPVRKEVFEHVGVLADVKVAHKLDEDKKGFWLAAAIPLSVVPQIKKLKSGFRTMVNFEATLGGRTKFWWANTGNTNNTLTTDEPSEARFYPGSWSQARFTW